MRNTSRRAVEARRPEAALFTIRSASHHDLDGLYPLYWRFHEHHASHLPDRVLSTGAFEQYDRATLDSALVPILESREEAVFIAENADRLVGFAEARMVRDHPQPGRVLRYYAHLASLFVAASFRRRGIGTRLIAAVEEWAAEQNATEVRLDVWEFAEGPLSFYEREGYRTLSRTLVKPIDE